MKLKITRIQRFGTLIAGIGLLISVIMVVLLIGDFQEFRNVWYKLQWKYIVWLLPLAALNLAIRYWRWEIMLKYVSAVDFKRSSAVILFSAGSLLIFTPGRAGEIAKSVYAREFFGIPISKSLPVLIAERLSDVLVMALLAGLGLFLIGETPGLLVGGIIVLIILAMVILRTSILARLARWKAPSFMKNSGIGEFLSQASNTQISLFKHTMLIPNFILGASAWMIEITIFFLSLSALGAETHFHPFVLALAFFPLASLAGSLSFFPGGLGVTEGGLIALGILVGGLSEETIVLATLFTRTAIFGVVVLAGIVSLLLLRNMPRLE